MKKTLVTILICLFSLLLFPNRVLAIEDVIGNNSENIIEEDKKEEITNNIDMENNNNEEKKIKEEESNNEEKLNNEEELKVDGENQVNEVSIENTEEKKEELETKNIVETKNEEKTLSIEKELQPQNGVPLVIIRVNEDEEAIQAAETKDPEHEYGNIEEMNSSKHHTTRAIGTVEIIVPENFECNYDLTNSPVGEKELSYIRGRGNSTWMISNKKPYKIKYDKKQDVLGMGANKEWGLLANSFDPTLTHNAIASLIAEEMGMEYTPKMLPVEVVMIGSESGSTYLGSYYISELVDINKTRVNIKELDEDDTKNITGGYLISIYYDEQDFKEPENTVFETEYSNIKFINENPYFDEGELTEGQEKQRTYIRNYINQIDDLIMNNEEIDENIHKQINELLDLKSTADFWLIQEFFINFDGYKTSSNYLYKKENGKLYWGPLWDFDLMLYMVDEDEPSHIEGFNKVLSFPWLDKLRSNDPEFVKLIKSEWEIMDQKIAELIEEGGILDQLKERQREAWNANYEIWKQGNYYDNDTTIDEEFEKMRTIIENRRNWFNDNLDDIKNVYSTVTYMVDDEIVKAETIRTGSLLEEYELKPQKEGLLFDGWVDKETNEKREYTLIQKDTILIPKYINPSDIEEEITVFLTNYEDWVSLDNEEYENSLKVYPEDYYELIKNNTKWTSSNEKVAKVDNGIVKLLSVGDTNITATIYNGTSKTYLLHVFDDSYETIEEPEDIILEKDSYTLEVGDLEQIIYSFYPNKPINPDNYLDVYRYVDDEEIIDVDYGGCFVIKALKEGTTKIKLELYSGYSEKSYVTKTINVTVVAKKETTNEEQGENKVNTNNNTVNNNGTGNIEPSINNNAITKLVNKKESSTQEEDTTKEDNQIEEETKEESKEKTKEESKEKHTKEESKDNNHSTLIIVLLTLSIIACLLFLILKNNNFE